MPSALYKSACSNPGGLKPNKRKAARIVQLEEAKQIASANARRFATSRGWVRPSSDFPKASRQSDPLVDRTVLTVLDRKLASGGHFTLTAAPSRLVRPRPVSELNRLKRWGPNYTLLRRARHFVSKAPSPMSSGASYLIHVPHWDHASEVWKTLAYVSCIPVGQRLAFTLNLDPDVAFRAMKSAKGPSKFLQDRIAAALRRAFPEQCRPSFLLHLETVQGSNRSAHFAGLHVHGIIERPQMGQSIQQLKEALRHAGGKIRDSSRARQLLIRSALNPIGWTAYIYKNRLSTASAIRETRILAGVPTGQGTDTVLAASSRLRAQAQAWYAARRRDENPIWVSRKRMIAPIAM